MCVCVCLCAHVCSCNMFCWGQDEYNYQNSQNYYENIYYDLEIVRDQTLNDM